jgi:O-antigen ligase
MKTVQSSALADGDRTLGSRLATAYLAAMLVGLHLIVDPRIYDVSQLPRLLALLVGLTIAVPVVLCLPAVKCRVDGSALRSPIVAAAAAYLVACGLSLVGAINISAGFTDLFRTLAAFLVLCLGILVLPLDHRWRDRLLEMAVIATLVAVVVGGWPVATLLLEGWPSRRAVEELLLEGMMSNVNLFAGFLLLVVPWCVCGACVFSGPWRGLATAVGTLATILIAVLQSRAAWLGWVAALTVTMATLLRHSQELAVPPAVRRSLVRGSLAAVIAALLLVGLALTDTPAGESLRRLVVNRPHQADGPSDGGRTLVWGLTTQMIIDHPIGGVGAGNFPIRLHEYFGSDRQDLPPDFSRLSSHNWMQPHNDFLWVGAEKGLLGIVPFALVLLLSLLAIRTILMRSSNPTDARLATASLAALGGNLVFSCLDFPLDRVSHQTVLAVHLAVIVLLERATRAASTRPLPLPGWLVAPPLLAALVLGITYAAAALSQEHSVMIARRAEHDGDWLTMREAARQGTTPWKTLDPLGVPVAFLEGMADLRLGNHAAATACFERALAANPNRLYVLQNLGAGYAQAGRVDDAIITFAVAADRYPSNVEVRHNLASALIDSGRFAEAIAVIEDVPEGFRTPGMQEALLYAHEAAGEQAAE